MVGLATLISLMKRILMNSGSLTTVLVRKHGWQTENQYGMYPLLTG